MIGEIVGSYRIISKLSVGGMGTVYRAEHTLMGKLAAVKVLKPELTTNRDIVNRFANEARATTQIKHPGIVEVFDFGFAASGDAYITMEFLEGVSLARRLKRGGKLDAGEAAMLLRAVCNALSAAHAKGIVHRDLKPDNIFLVNDAEAPLGYRAKVLDFGIAKLTDIGLAGTATKTGAVMGTPTYMSPEQCRGTGEVDARADLYSIGCIYYELVTGRPPFVNLGAGELIGAHIYEEPDPPSKHAPVDAATEALILLLLQKRAANRPASAREVAQRLAAIAIERGWKSSDNSFDSSLHAEAMAVPPTVVEQSTVGYRPERAAAAVERSGGAEVVGQPTTLSGAASQSMVRSRPRRGALLIGGVTAVALAIIAVAWQPWRDSGEVHTHAAIMPVTPPPAATTPTPTPTPMPATTAQTKSPEPTAPPPPTPPVADPVERPAPPRKRVRGNRDKGRGQQAPQPAVRTDPPPPPPPPDPNRCEQPPCIIRSGP